MSLPIQNKLAARDTINYNNALTTVLIPATNLSQITSPLMQTTVLDIQTRSVKQDDDATVCC